MGIKVENALHVSRKICDQLQATLASLSAHPVLHARDFTQPEHFENFRVELRCGVAQFVDFSTLLGILYHLHRSDVERPVKLITAHLLHFLHNSAPMLHGHEEYLSGSIVPQVKTHLRVLADETEFWDSLDACLSDSHKRLTRTKEQLGLLARYAESPE